MEQKKLKKRTNPAICMKLIGLVKPLTGHMLLAILLGTIGHLCAAFITILGIYGITGLLGFPVSVSMSTVFVTVCIFAVLRGALHYGEQACNHYIAFTLLALLRDKVFRALRRLCPAKLEGKDKGNLISVITSDIELLEVFYAHTISPVAIAFCMSVVMTVFIGQYHILLGVVALVAYMTVGIVVPVITSKANGENGIRFRTKSGELSSYVLDSLRGLGETLQYHTGEQRLEKMNRKTDELAEDDRRMKLCAGKSTAVTNTMLLGFDIFMLFTAGYLYQKGSVDFQGVIVPFVALMSSFGPVIALANLGSTLQNTFAAGDRVLDILEETPMVEDVLGKKEIAFEGAKVKDVSFSYGEEQILNHVSVEIPKNSVIGIVGRSGSGKSTLLRLLMRFWNVRQGSVEISDTQIGKINTENLRNMEGFVTQETHLFHDSIKNNVRIGQLDATDEEIIEACKKASIHDFIMTLPNGYDTQVGELGDTLSGGEKQRIGLARAFLHDAPFLLLDEPTSNLDSLNEAVILRSIAKEKGDKTVVMVSHRVSTMRIAQQVYSVEHGRNS